MGRYVQNKWLNLKSWNSVCNVICEKRNTHTYTHTRLVYTKTFTSEKWEGRPKDFCFPPMSFELIDLFPLSL